MNKEALIAEAVRRAQEDAQKKGLNIGQTVAHPSDPLTYCLLSVEENIATVGLTAKQSRDGKVITKQFPLDELFDPNTARNLVDQVMEDDLNNGLPPGCGVMIVKL